ncbi:MAG: ATP-binding protein [Actinomycetota bacterium]
MTGDLPTGVVTFMFTDIEGSTRLVHELGDGYGDVLADQRRILREVWTRWRGVERSTEGDSFFVVFRSPADAVAAAADAQRRLTEHTWPHGCRVRVRMGMHTGPALVVDDDYFGIDVNRAARIAGTSHGGQVVISRATAELIDPLPDGLTLKDLGEHRLKDLAQPEWLFQVMGQGLDEAFPPIRSLEVPTNLPHPATPLVGRASELAELDVLLAQDGARLLTLTGPGGAGKTRLAIEAASLARERFPNGVFFVSLAAVAEPADVLVSVAHVLGVEIGVRPAAERLAEDLRVRSLLLVLDNFEHVSAAAPEVAALVDAAPRLRVLVTSRAPLRVGAEREYPVGPLDTTAGSAGSPAAALFIERARAVKPSLRLTPDDAAAIEQICGRLDGLPLAIELAAARMRTLNPAQILERLSSRLTLLKGGARDLPARQQTLRDTIAWSVGLLDQPTAAVFRHFAVFAGGATVGSLEAVLSEDDDPLGGLDVLVEHNLVLATQDGTRFDMLQTIREFALERLDDCAEADAVRDAHAEHFAELAEQGDANLRGPEQADWRSRLVADVANFRAALSWCLGPSSTGERSLVGARLAGALGWFWYTHADAVEGSRWLSLARERAPDAPIELRARVSSRLGILHDQRGEFAAAAPLFESAREAYRALGDQKGVASSLNSMGSATRNGGDLAGARRYFEEALAVRRAIGDEGGQASSTHNLGVIALDEGDGGRALALFEQSAALDAASGDVWGQAIDGCGLADAHLLLGNVERAETLVAESLRALVEIGERDWVGEALSVASAVASARGDLARGSRLAGAAWGTWMAIGFPPSGKDLERHRARTAPARAGLDPADFERAHAEGEALTYDQAVEYALRGAFGANAPPDA